ncbi:MAG: hypothetical protein ACRCTZ_17375 [Sarcina sp.]
MGFLTLAITVGWAVGTGYLAKKKGLNFVLWGAIGGFFYLAGLLLCIGYSLYTDHKKSKGLKPIAFEVFGKREFK